VKPARFPFEGREMTVAEVAALTGAKIGATMNYLRAGATCRETFTAMRDEMKRRQWMGTRRGGRASLHVSLMPGEFRT
jgi:hypothetical protein